MKNIRIIVSLILFIPSFPFISLTVSVFGTVIIIGLCTAITYPIFWLSKNVERMKDAKEGFIMGTAFMWYPFSFWINWIKTGEMNLVG